jgi:hypothetical protein
LSLAYLAVVQFALVATLSQSTLDWWVSSDTLLESEEASVAYVRLGLGHEGDQNLKLAWCEVGAGHVGWCYCGGIVRFGFVLDSVNGGWKVGGCEQE